MNRHSNFPESFNEPAALQLLPRIAPSSYAPSMATVVASDVKREVSRQAWEEMKPRIQQLYMYQNRPFPHVARALREEYGFEPTKRQFSRKAAEWGFKKNITRAERRVLLLNILKHGHGALLDFADRRIHPAKIENLRKRYSDELSDLEKQPSSSFHRLSSQHGESLDLPINSTGNSRQHTPSAEVEASSADDSSMDWAADAPPYSQPLSQLLEALEAALSSSSPLSITSLSGGAQTISLEDIRELSCESNKFLIYDLNQPPVMTQQKTVHTYTEDNERAQLPWRDIKSIFFGWNESPLNEVYVFPRPSVNSPRTVSITSKTLWDSLRDQEIELTNKIAILKRSLAPNHLALIAATEALALINYDQGNFIQAEISLHRVEKLQAETLGPTSLKTLSTSRLIGEVLRLQGKYRQAWEVIKRIEPAILSLVDPDHDLAVEVMVTKSLLLNDMGDSQGAEIIDRQVLQIRLQAFGPRDLRTRRSMNHLGNSLVRMEEYNGAEKLLRTALQVHSMDADMHNWRAYQVMMNIGWALACQKSYDESHRVLYDAVQRSKISLGPEHLETLALQNRFAWTLYWQRRLKESEEIFREVWSLQCKLLGESTYISISTIQGLAWVLKEMDRFGEAIEWSKKIFERSLDAYGPENEWTLEDCDHLGECYEKEGRYVDALELYQQMVEKLRSSGSIEHPAVARFESYIEDIHEAMSLED